jgi:hypothetical protein
MLVRYFLPDAAGFAGAVEGAGSGALVAPGDAEALAVGSGCCFRTAAPEAPGVSSCRGASIAPPLAPRLFDGCAPAALTAPPSSPPAEGGAADPSAAVAEPVFCESSRLSTGLAAGDAATLDGPEEGPGLPGLVDVEAAAPDGPPRPSATTATATTATAPNAPRISRDFPPAPDGAESLAFTNEGATLEGSVVA